ncbi:MAG: PaaI family thioesterase [Candidatus Caldatribacteriaceae bacterium]
MEKIEMLKEQFRHEQYAQFFDFRLEALEEGYAKVSMKIKPDFQNIFQVTHGGAIFSLIDEAFEMACNSHLEDAVALSVTVNYLKPARGSYLVASCREVALTRKTGTYDIEVRNEEGELVALARALSYRK